MKDNYKILIIEDEVKILDVIASYLKNEGYDVYSSVNGLDGLKLFESISPHLVILDLMLPGLSGEEICRSIRITSNTPVLMLTAKSSEESKIQGFTIGADDYVTKPFSPRELVQRVKAILRRSYEKDIVSNTLSFDNILEIDITSHEVSKDGKIVNLTPNEYKILKIFALNPGQVFTREQLVEKAFGYDYEGYDRTIDTHIKNLRQKIEDNPKSPKYILTVYGIGYKFGG